MRSLLRTFNLALLLLLLAVSSCKKWLDVSPKTQIKESEQFENRQGFIDALFGMYQKLTINGLYGANLSYGMIDILAQRYENKTSTTDAYYNLTRYNYLFHSTDIATIWSQQYAAIAQCNFIIDGADKYRTVLTDEYYGIIKGEALGMRAFLHFDLIRLYAPAWADGANENTLSIPYMAKFELKQQDKLTLGAALLRCENDLKEAETLLSVYPGIDQIADNQGSTSPDLFHMYRQNHFNYWAAKATLARLYLYKGAKEQALKYAKEVIDGKKFRFMFTNSELDVDPASAYGNLTFTPEHILSLYVSDMKTSTDGYFKPAVAGVPDASDLFTTRVKLNNMYEVQTPGYTTDIRNPFAAKTVWIQVTTNAVYTKKYHVDNAQNVRESLVPLLRLPEMYYIAAEAAPTLAEGVAYLNTVRTARLLPALSPPSSATILNDEIQKEYRKEFYGEGQLWYYYKRKNVVNIPDGAGNPMTPAKYIFNIPDAELQFGQ